MTEVPSTVTLHKHVRYSMITRSIKSHGETINVVHTRDSDIRSFPAIFSPFSSRTKVSKNNFFVHWLSTFIIMIISLDVGKMYKT